MIDAIDTKILNIVQSNSKTSNADIAREVGMAPSAVFERIKKLEEKGLIKEYTARLNAKALGKGLLAFILIRTESKKAEANTGKLLAEFPEILEVHHIAGEDCYLIKVRTSDTEALGELLEDKFRQVGSVVSTKTTIVLNTIKETSNIEITLNEEN